MLNSKNYSEKLVELRGNRSQREIAMEIGVSPSTVSMYEMGERIPSDSVKVKLAELYGVTVGSLFFNQE